MASSYHHEEDHNHSHHHHYSGEKNLIFTIFLNIIITVAEIAGGLLSGSLALLSDAFHNLSDVISLFVSYIAILIGKKDKNLKKTYGYKRAEIIAAFFNVLILFFVCGYIIFEAVHRISHPSPINVKLMFIVAVIGFAANGVSALVLFRDSRANINIRSAFLHLLADTLSSVAVIVTAIILVFRQWIWLDAAISILITAYIAKESVGLLLESLHILMQGSPRSIKEEDIKIRVMSDYQLKIEDIHHIHMWEMAPGQVVFDAHVVVKKERLIESDYIIKALEKILSEDFGICHSTLQVESSDFDHCVTCEL